jgi:arginine/serine-rich splicing factor 7
LRSLPKDPPPSEDELRQKFERYGELKDVWVARKPPGFAFVQFQDPANAEDAVRQEAHNRERWRVEISHKDPGDKASSAPKKRSERPPERDRPKDDDPPPRGSPTPLRERDRSDGKDKSYGGEYDYEDSKRHSRSRRSRSRSRSGSDRKERHKSRDKGKEKEKDRSRKSRKRTPPSDEYDY